MTTPTIHCAHDKVWPLKKFKPNPRNPNTHPAGQLKLLAKIITTQGWRSPITVSKLSGFIVKGHGRLEAAKIAGLTHAPVDLQDYATPEAEMADLIADNRLAELAEMDNPHLKALIDELKAAGTDLDLTGFDERSIDDLLSQFHQGTQHDAPPRIDQAAELNKKWQVKIGDLWQIGGHRLICGDSTNAATVALLMGEDKASLVWTDPPYGVKYGDKMDDLNAQHYRVRSIKNDGLTEEQLLELQRAAYSLAAKHSAPGGSIYAAATTAGNMLKVAIDAFQGSGFTFKWLLVWVKNSLVLSRSDYHFRHENILFGWKEDAGHFFIDDRKQDSVFLYDRPSKSDEHPMMKPIGLVAHMIKNSSRLDEIVYDCFLGSGTTMIACQNEQRLCRGVELSPDFCAVILQRMVDAFPALTIERLSNGSG